jgi:predicted nucleotidyltransferase
MYNKEINLDTVARVAEGLQELRYEMVFIGGAVISLYTDDVAAEEIRPTQDVDLTINLGSGYYELVKMNARLSELGFNPTSEGKSICRYQFDKIDVDIMPASDSVIGPSNRWYLPGFENLIQYTLDNGFTINLLSAPYFLATKFEAFKDRGNNDYRGSADFEDIIYVLDNRTTIVDEILAADDDVINFLQEELALILKSASADEILSMHIHPLVVEERFPILMEKIHQILEH